MATKAASRTKKATVKPASRITVKTVAAPKPITSPWSLEELQKSMAVARAKVTAFGTTTVRVISKVQFSYTPILVTLLIVAAYFIGSLRTQVGYLQQQNKQVSSLGAPQVAAAATNTATSAAAPSPTAGPIIPVTADEHIRGDVNAPVTLLLYSDFECPFCKQFQPTLQQIMSDYSGKVRLVYRQFPLPFHQNAEKEAEASECVTELGGNDDFWKFNDDIFQRTTSNGTGFALTALGPLAAEIGVDQTQFQSCLDSGKYAQKVSQDEAGGTTAGVDGTPTMFILAPDGSKQIVPGAETYDQIKPMIDAALQKT